MSAGMIGADPQVLREIATNFDSVAQELTRTRSSVQKWVDRTDIWRGLDNRGFEAGWSAGGATAIATAVGELQKYAKILRSNADAQENASTAENFRGGGSGLFLTNGQSNALMAGISSGVQGFLNAVDYSFGWEGEVFDKLFRTSLFSTVGALAQGASKGWALADDLATNGGRRFFEHSAGAALGILGGAAGAKFGMGLGAAAGTVLIPVPGVGTAVGAVIGATAGGLIGSLAGDAFGSGIGSIMDHSARGEGIEFVAPYVAAGLTSARPLPMPFAF